jgi:hypothetical protein
MKEKKFQEKNQQDEIQKNIVRIQKNLLIQIKKQQNKKMK